MENNKNLYGYFLSVDFQNEFAGTQGKYRVSGNSPEFVVDTLLPFLRDKGIKVSEIVSDYRLPRGKSVNESCIPGTYGFISLIPDSMRRGRRYIKCMHSPLWTRDGIGRTDITLGKEYQDPKGFDMWLDEQMPDRNQKVFLFGETMECCVLGVAQELYFRGYDVYVIYEATDPMPERQLYKSEIAKHSTLTMYAKVIVFQELIGLINNIYM